MQSKQSPGSPQSDNSLDFLDAPQSADKERSADREREFAQIYVEVFQHNPLGAQLLAQWEKAYFWKPTPTNASIQQYAADEALRQFIRAIRGQIEHVAQGRSAK